MSSEGNKKQTKYCLIYLKRKVRLMFWEPKDTIRVKCYLFSVYIQRNKNISEYLGCKLQEDGYCECIFKLKCHKTVQRTYLETSKQ